MSWTAPRTWTNGSVVTDVDLNTHVKNNLRYLRGMDGPITLDDSLSLNGGLNVGNASGAVTGEVKATFGTFSGNLSTGGTLAATGVVGLRGASLDPNIACTIKGIGTTSGTRGLRVTSSSGTVNLDISDNGAGSLNAASWSYASDARLKKNIKKYNTARAQLAHLAAIEIEQFDYKDGAAGQIGYVAQALREVIPDAVSEAEDGTLLVRSLEPWIVLWLQQLAARVDALTARVDALEPAH